MRAPFVSLPLLLVAAYALPATELTGHLPRDADLGFHPRVVNEALVVTDLDSESAAARAGVANGDVIAPGEAIDEMLDRLLRHNGNTRLTLELRRGDDRQTRAFTPPPAALPTVDGFEIELGDVETPSGHRLRTLVAVPNQASHPRPALFLTQWVSCGSVVDWFAGRDQVLGQLGRDLNVLILLAERASDGDSEGPRCDQLDYDTEISDYLAALRQLGRHPGVDSDQIYLYGSSLGSTTAPLIAERLQQENTPVAGVAIQGGGALTYFERMLNFDRAWLERRPDQVAPAALFDEMQQRALFHAEYLIKQRHPDEVAKDSPAMARVRSSIRGMNETAHYGRPFAWHQQAAQKNFLRAWTAFEAPVLVMFTEFDQFEIEHGHWIIAEMINRIAPRRATYRLLPGLGHSNWRFADAIEAYADETGYYDPIPLRSALRDWLTHVLDR